MSEKRCYYTILGVPMDASDDDIKRSYRQLALSLHPDKNPDRIEDANNEFRHLQQAYDVLSDPKERLWYDRHRDAILAGNSDIADEGIDLFPYFSSYCYTSFKDDDDNGFYNVYDRVFRQIVNEDLTYRDDDNCETPPEFGKSDSSYQNVHAFYSFWQSYCTLKSYSWLDKYSILDAPNRRIARLIEKENKKLRDAAKKKRNEQIRQLVEFIRKRDKRVIEQRKKAEIKSEENKRKNELMRRKRIEQRNEELEKEMSNYRENEWSSMAALEDELKEIEQRLDDDHNDKVNVQRDSDDSDDDDNRLYCIACDKTFKSDKAFENHEKSKKHKSNVATLKEVLENDLRVADH